MLHRRGGTAVSAFFVRARKSANVRTEGASRAHLRCAALKRSARSTWAAACRRGQSVSAGAERVGGVLAYWRIGVLAYWRGDYLIVLVVVVVVVLGLPMAKRSRTRTSTGKARELSARGRGRGRGRVVVWSWPVEVAKRSRTTIDYGPRHSKTQPKIPLRFLCFLLFKSSCKPSVYLAAPSGSNQDSGASRWRKSYQKPHSPRKIIHPVAQRCWWRPGLCSAELPG